MTEMQQAATDLWERFGLWLQNRWNKPLRCMLGDHDDMSVMTAERWFLQCQGCGRETPGFDLRAEPPRQTC